ncbi:MAG: hypothetical protein CSA22_07405 [Deltaproteobacteria bacterium]|nr:MAG: hypothetical protein CSA22_07405 [Deltaproteobacteria bacterium]
MIITCQECQTSFSLDDSLIKPSGSKVRCSVCKNIFLAYPEPETPAHTIDAFIVSEESAGERSVAWQKDDGAAGIPGEELLPGIDSLDEEDLGFSDDEIQAIAEATFYGDGYGFGALEGAFPETASDSFSGDAADLPFESETLSFDDRQMDDRAADETPLKDDDGVVEIQIEDVEALPDASPSPVEPQSPMAGDDDFDFSDLEALLDRDDDGAGVPSTVVTTGFDESDAAVLADAGSAADEAGDYSLDALEFESDDALAVDDASGVTFSDLESVREGDPKADTPEADALLEISDVELPGEADSGQVDADDLDFSEIESMLEAEGVSVEPKTDDSHLFDLTAALETDGDLAGVAEVPVDDLVSVEDDDLDFSDLEAALEADDDLVGVAKAPVDDLVSVEDDDLDFSDLEAALEADDDLVGVAEASADDVVPVEDDDLDFSDLEAALEADDDVSAGGGPEDALDLSDLESFLDADDDAPDIDLDEDIDFSLDLDGDEASVDAELDAGIDDLLDFSDLEAELDAVRDADSEGDTTDDDLDFSLDLDDDDMSVSDDDFLDFSDLEDLLEADDGEKVAETDKGDTDMELDLSLDDSVTETIDLEALEAQAAAQSGDNRVNDAEDDLDFSDLEAMLDEAGVSQFEADVQEADDEVTVDIDADMESEETQLVDEAEMEAAFAAGAAFGAGGDPEVTMDADISEPIPVEAPVKKKTVRSVRRKKSKLLMVLIVPFLLLGGVVGGLWYAVTQLGIEIPVVSDYLAPKPKDPVGALHIKILDAADGQGIKSRFVENNRAGTLLVIEGKVRNDYSAPRSFLRLRGKLMDKNGGIAKAQTVYAGNTISQIDLAQLSKMELDKKLKNRFGDKRANVNVKRRDVLPFVIVFDKLPEGMDNYELNIEVAGSMAAAEK